MSQNEVYLGNGPYLKYSIRLHINAFMNLLGVPVSYQDLPYQGITELTSMDLEMAEEFGYRVKLLASARSTDGRVEAWVHPALVPEKHPLAAVDDLFNSVYIEDDKMGPSMYYGRGAGALPTGSAVVADIVSCSRDILSGAVGRVPVIKVNLPNKRPVSIKSYQKNSN